MTWESVPHPFIYEINTWPWLASISAQEGRTIDLGSVPAAYWDEIAGLGFDAVWLMGVWQRSPAGIQIALANDDLRDSFQAALSDWRDADVVGSPYCIRDYVVDDHLGGPAGLAVAREALAARGLRLILDFVPNHVAPDHPWTTERPELFVAGTDADLDNDPASFVEVGGRVLARGRDPYFPAWPDVVQLNAIDPGLRTCRGRDGEIDCRPVRWRALRHGDADDERRFHPDLGCPGRPRTCHRVLAHRDRRRSATPTPGSCSWPRRTGTWNGR